MLRLRLYDRVPGSVLASVSAAGGGAGGGGGAAGGASRVVSPVCIRDLCGCRSTDICSAGGCRSALPYPSDIYYIYCPLPYILPLVVAATTATTAAAAATTAAAARGRKDQGRQASWSESQPAWQAGRQGNHSKGKPVSLQGNA
eukprot:GHVU01158100.1.p2 GENE.GHVU01158100.1~~GHVU01158100.1.p2  ORF type:complete len:144 (-),score=25.56 GHVU01158100.1:488-919(-)